MRSGTLEVSRYLYIAKYQQDGVNQQEVQMRANLEVRRYLQQRGVRHYRYLNNIFESEIKDIAATKTISGGAKFADSLLFQRVDDFVQRWASMGWGMVSEPFHKIERLARPHFICANGISVEVIRNDGLITNIELCMMSQGKELT